MLGACAHRIGHPTQAHRHHITTEFRLRALRALRRTPARDVRRVEAVLEVVGECSFVGPCGRAGVGTLETFSDSA